MILTPQQMTKHVAQYAKNMEKALRSTVKVGLPQGKVGSKVYDSGATVLQIGAGHEFGSGNLPRRSFLRMPFILRQAEIAAITDKQFFKVIQEGKDATVGLSMIGVFAQTVSQEAFETGGYGQWPDIKQETKDEKGSSAILIDKGTLRQSITWVIE